MASDKRLRGNHGEDLAASWLTKAGYCIIARNYHVREGEIDLIAVRDDVVAFVEVKTRHVKYFSIPQSVTITKQKRIIKAARHYIHAHSLTDKVFRFDIAAVHVNGSTYDIEYIENAFTTPH